MSVRFCQFVVTLLVYALTLVGVAPANACDRRSTYYIDHWHSAYGQNNWFSDPDGDGVVNYVEFGFGTNPLSAAPGQGMEQVQPKVRLNANGQMELVILQPNLPCDSGGYGRYWFWISVLESPDLQSWNEIAIKYGGGTGFRPREGYSVTATQLPAGNWEVVITEQQPAAGRKWFRLSFYIVS